MAPKHARTTCNNEATSSQEHKRLSTTEEKEKAPTEEQQVEAVCEQSKATVGRWGGDEFVIFGEFNDDATPQRLIDNLKTRVLIECNDDERFIVSVSIGAAKLREFENLKHLFDEADHMLYEDKAKFHKSNS